MLDLSNSKGPPGSSLSLFYLFGHVTWCVCIRCKFCSLAVFPHDCELFSGVHSGDWCEKITV